MSESANELVEAAREAGREDGRSEATFHGVEHDFGNWVDEHDPDAFVYDYDEWAGTRAELEGRFGDRISEEAWAEAEEAYLAAYRAQVNAVVAELRESWPPSVFDVEGCLWASILVGVARDSGRPVDTELLGEVARRLGKDLLGPTEWCVDDLKLDDDFDTLETVRMAAGMPMDHEKLFLRMVRSVHGAESFRDVDAYEERVLRALHSEDG